MGVRIDSPPPLAGMGSASAIGQGAGGGGKYGRIDRVNAMSLLYGKIRDGRVSPSFTVQKNNFKMALTLALAAGNVLLSASPSVAQGRFFRPRPPRAAVRRQNLPRTPAKLKVDPATLLLLQKMMRPTSDYSGEQITETTAGGGRTSQQRIIGDTGGRVRLDYAAPANLAGDVMVRGPGQYRYLSQRTKTLRVALWPTEYNESDKREINEIKTGRLQVTQVGQETVAGRNAAIIEMDAPNFSRKFWIDMETGIQLKIEVSGPGGLISRTYITSIQIGPTAGVTRQMFNVPNPNNFTVESLFPNSARYDNLNAATPNLPFAPLVPNPPPAGFRLSGVWVFNVNQKRAGSGSVLLRYSDGVGNFSLYERLSANAPAPPKNPNARRRFRGGIVNWKEALSNGGGMDVTYIGHLTPEQIGLLHDSLR